MREVKIWHLIVLQGISAVLFAIGIGCLVYGAYLFSVYQGWIKALP